MKNYFSSKKGERKGSKIGFPKFKSKKRAKLSFTLAWDAIGSRHYAGHNLQMPRMDTPINMAEPLRFTGKVKETTISYSGGYWWASAVVELEQPAQLQHEQASIGVDVGIKTLATLSDGVEFENQKLLRRELKKLKRLSRRISRRSVLYKLRKTHPEVTQHQLLGYYAAACAKAKEETRPVESKRWKRASVQLIRHQAHIANQRSYAIHKMTKQIAETYHTIGIEDLNIKGMLKNRRLSSALSDASFGEIFRQLQYKSEATGGRVIKVGRFYASSKTCNHCGHIHKELTLSHRTWTCEGCGMLNQSDWNASKNIEAEALRLIGA